MMFDPDDPNLTAEQKMGRAFACLVCVAGIALVLVAAGIYAVVRSFF